MKIALLHYHLKTGGVTTVLRQQAAALQDIGECLILTGDRATGQWPCRVVVIPELGYDRPGAFPPPAERIAEQVCHRLDDAWPGGCDILHVHNPTLAKNRGLLKVIKRLQQTGVNLFLQIHDFAEDGRPEVYYEEEYPSDCHYGVINTRDARVLKQAGLVDDGLHYLPNAIDRLPCDDHRPRKAQILYPVRAIRRKNLGEVILLSLFLRVEWRVAITQPPNSPTDTLSYRDWMQWVRVNHLPVDFEVGRRTPFPVLVGESESMVTTSIAEGFGFSFLEPWTAGKPLWGRRVEGICDDFETNGVNLDGLYERLDIPLSWIDAAAFERRWSAAVVGAAARFGRPLPDGVVEQAYARMIDRDCVDFGLLGEPFQRQVGERLLSDPSAKPTLIELNSWLRNPGEGNDAAELIENNRRAVLRHYDAESYRKRLLSVYDRVARHRVHHRIEKSVLHRSFFDLDRFSLLKWESYEGL